MTYATDHVWHVTNNSVYVNGIHVETALNYTVLQLCNIINVYIPRFCYHDKLSIAGNCRMCLVEVYKVVKPVISCATLLINDLEIFTDTAIIKNSREHILEFLLINHPLDCPICDQGGECDLQDQSLLYGSDRGRFKEIKRSVTDKIFNPFIRSIMTRCIHCTRCIRFLEELTDDLSVGLVGRGKDMEISMYVLNNIVSSELSGNIIDLCPVGALTSKPYSFVARSWELRSTDSIDLFDGMGTGIRVDSKASEIVRILPLIDESINEHWITDKIRFCYDGFRVQRLTSPLIRIQLYKYFDLKEDKKYKNKTKQGSFNKSFFFQIKNFFSKKVGLINKVSYLTISWDYIFKKLLFFYSFFLLKEFSFFSFIFGKFIDLETIYLISLLQSKLGYSFLFYENLILKSSIDLRQQYLFNKSFVSLDYVNTYLFLNNNLKYESPLLSLRINKRYKQNKVIGYFGVYYGNLINNFFFQLGVTFCNFYKLIQGRHYFSFLLKHSTNVYFLLSSNFISENFQFYFYFLFSSLNKLNSNKLNCFDLGYLINNSTIPIFFDLGLISPISSSYIDFQNNFHDLKKKYFNALCYILNLDLDLINFPFLSDIDWNTNNHRIVIYQGNHGHSNLISLWNKLGYKENYAHIILPTSSFLEKNSHYVNMEGILLSSQRAILSPGLAKDDSNILSILIKILFNNSFYNLNLNKKKFLYKLPFLQLSYELMNYYLILSNYYFFLYFFFFPFFYMYSSSLLFYYYKDLKAYYLDNLVCKNSPLIHSFVNKFSLLKRHNVAYGFISLCYFVLFKDILNKNILFCNIVFNNIGKKKELGCFIHNYNVWTASPFDYCINFLFFSKQKINTTTFLFKKYSTAMKKYYLVKFIKFSFVYYFYSNHIKKQTYRTVLNKLFKKKFKGFVIIPSDIFYFILIIVFFIIEYLIIV